MITIRQGAALIRAGKIVAFPTESFWALGVDATNPDAIRMLYKKKLRMRNKPIALVAADVNQVKKYLRLNPAETVLAKKHWPGPLTMILQPRKQKRGLQTTALGAARIGVRVPAHAVARQLAKLAGVPITATSANVSAESPTKSARRLQYIFPLMPMVRGRCGNQRKPSTVVISRGTYFKIIRPGAINLYA